MAFKDWFWILLLGGIWGFSFIFNAVLIQELGPLWVSALRVCIGALGCWAVLFALKKPLPRDPALWFKLGALGLLAYRFPLRSTLWRRAAWPVASPQSSTRSRPS